MKIRTDFVTNSSSSSFILARKGDLTPEQEHRIIEKILPHVMGNVELEPGCSDEDIKKFEEDNYLVNGMSDKIRKQLEDGKSIYRGWIIHEYDMPDYSEIAEIIWKELSKDPDTFVGIDTDLSY